MYRFPFKRAATVLALALLLLGGARLAPAGGTAKSDKDGLQGSWTCETAKKGGDEAPKELIESLKLTIKGDKLTLHVGGEAKEGSYKLDESKKPKHIDLNVDDKTIEGIYELKGNTLTITATHEPGKARPADFKGTGEEIHIVFKRAIEKKEEKKDKGTLRRAPARSFVSIFADDKDDKDKKDKKGGPEFKGDQAKVQGDWLVDSIEKGGEKVPEELTKSIKVTIKGTKISIAFGGEAKEGSFKVDETKKPKQIDLTLDGKESLAIYEFDGGKLKICGAEPGQERPKDFKGADNIIFIFKRGETKKEPAKDKKEDPKDKKKADGGQVRLAPGDEACCEVFVGDTPKKTDRDLLQGGWTCIAGERGGEKAPEDFIKAFRMTFKDDQVTITIGPMTKSGTAQIDPAKSPKHITMKIEGEAKAGIGIYKLDGDTLTLAIGGEDVGRPEGFVSGQGQKFMVLVFKRGATEPSKVDVAALQERAKRQVSANNLKQIGLAFHTYHDAMGTFPTAAIASKDGKPLLSWRVALLPYLEENQLYQQFKLDEPWDSPNNMKLLAKMPRVYGEPIKGKYETYYQVFTGTGAIFDGPKGIKLNQIVDGTSNTILAIEAGSAVPWTKPEDVAFDAKKELPKFGGLFEGGFHTLLADGSVRFHAGTVNADMMRRAIQRNDGMIVDLDKLTTK